MANAYMAIPIAITVEGANTLTRSLIIFGQGLTRSHPHLLDIMKAIQHGDDLKVMEPQGRTESGPTRQEGNLWCLYRILSPKPHGALPP